MAAKLDNLVDLRLRSFGMIWIRISLSDSWCIKGTGESMTRVESSAPLMHHDPDRFWITDPDRPKGTHLSSFLAAWDCDGGDVSLDIHEWL